MSLHVRRASWQVGCQTALLVLACFVLAGAVVFFTVERTASSAGWKDVRAAASGVTRPADAPPGIMVVIEEHGRRSASDAIPRSAPIEADLRSTAADGRERRRTLTLGGDRYRIVTIRSKARVVQAIYDDEAYEAERGRLFTALGIAGGVAVLLSALLGAWLARRSMRPMAQTLAMQERFVADASHELRTPLTLLSTRVQLLARRLRGMGTAELAMEADSVVADARRLAAVLDDLLLAVDPRRGTDLQIVDLATLVADVVSSAQAAAAERGCTLTPHVSETLVEGSATALQRAIVALVDNALEHAYGHVQVSVSRRGGKAVLEVADDGPGIDPRVVSHIFDRFASSKAADVSGRRHYGLGLALVAEIAGAHGGSVHAKNGPAGAVLTLELPARGIGPER